MDSRSPAPSAQMRIAHSGETPLRREREFYSEVLPLAGARIVELGCGRADHSRAIAKAWPTARIHAYEVDRIQLDALLQDTPPANLSFAPAGAEAIPEADAGCDIVMMFKSLHHVPLELLDRAFAEIHRVLAPGGFAYLSEPVFAGALNEILRVYHDEERVRAAAFAAIGRAVDSGRFELVREEFFSTPTHYANFTEFEDRHIKVTHTPHHLSPEQYATVRERFAPHVGPDGAFFPQPMRVDLLRKVG